MVIAIQTGTMFKIVWTRSGKQYEKKIYEHMFVPASTRVLSHVPVIIIISVFGLSESTFQIEFCSAINYNFGENQCFSENMFQRLIAPCKRSWVQKERKSFHRKPRVYGSISYCFSTCWEKPFCKCGLKIEVTQMGERFRSESEKINNNCTEKAEKCDTRRK